MDKQELIYEAEQKLAELKLEQLERVFRTLQNEKNKKQGERQ